MLWVLLALLVCGGAVVLSWRMFTPARVVAALLWSAIAVAPCALLAFESGAPFVVYLDHGAAAAMLALGAGLWWRSAGFTARAVPLWVVFVVFGIAAWMVAAETALTPASAVIVVRVLLAAACGALGWAVVALITSRVRRGVISHALALGAVAGAMSSVAGATHLATPAVAVVALVVGVAGALMARAGTLRRQIVALVLLPAGAGIIAVGLLGERVGVLSTGQPVQLGIQVAVAVLAFMWPCAAAAALRVPAWIPRDSSAASVTPPA